MTKKKLNNFILFVLFALPLFIVIIGFFFPKQEVHSYTESGVNSIIDTISYDNWGNYFMYEFKSWFYASPFYNALDGLSYAIFQINETNAVIPIISFISAYIVYMFFIAFCWIVKEFVFILFNVCNKFIFKEE